jgi:Spy/CpxP family protein refolding chaperone
MFKPTKIYLAALTVAAAVSFVSQPAFAQLEDMDDPSDMGELDIVINVPELGPGMDGPDFPPPPPGGPGGGGIAFSLPLPSPGDVIGAMRRGGCPVGGGKRGGCPLNLLEGENAVTDDHYEKLYELKNRVMDQRGPKMLELMTAKRHLRDLLTQETIDDKAAKKLQNQIVAAKSDLNNLELDAKMSMMQILTGGQRKELRKLMVQGPKRGPGGGMHHLMRKYMERKEGGK